MTKRYHSWSLPTASALLTALLSLLAVAGCDATNPGNTLDNTPCACAVGAKRCNGEQIQVCEATDPKCPTWGVTTTCPGGACANDSCGGSCNDTCPGGTTRCGGDTIQEICRIGPSGCLEWVAQTCPTSQYCGSNLCQPAISCDPTCPSGYMCKPTGVCAGGSPTGLILDVKTVSVSGKLTLNGTTPVQGTVCPGNPALATAQIELTEKAKGYVTVLRTFCSDNTFGFSGMVYPGTYTVRVNNLNGTTYSNIPVNTTNALSFVVNDALPLLTDTAGLMLDVKTVNVTGKVTLNGGAPTLGTTCAANPTSSATQIEFTDKAKGYVTVLRSFCNDGSFSFSGLLYPGTYTVRVNNINGTGYSNLPTATSNGLSFVVNEALPVTANTTGLILDVQTVSVSGKVTLNGAPPNLGTTCAANPTSSATQIEFTEPTKRYLVTLRSLCNDSTFSFSGQLYPGTYTVRVNNINGTGFSNLPTAQANAQSFVVSDALPLTAATAGLVFDVKTINASGKVTLNGVPPVLGASCTANPTSNSSQVEFTDPSKGYIFTLRSLCNDTTFGFSGLLYPGTYLVRVNNLNGVAYSNLPMTPTTALSFVVNDALPLTANTPGLVFDVKTVAVSGKVTLNGMTPTLGATCTANPTSSATQIEFTDKARGYLTTLRSFCNDNTFGFTGVVYPGTYTVRVNNPNGATYSNIPTATTNAQSFLANDALSLMANTPGLTLDVKTVTASGKVTLNGIAPILGPVCAGNPTVSTTQIEFSEKTKGYLTVLRSLCNDSTFGFNGLLYPGTYAVRVNNLNGTTYSNIPTNAANALSELVIGQIQIP